MSHPTQQRPLFVTVVAALVIALMGSAATLTMSTAQESSIPVDAPVDIHSGTCEDFLAEPAYDGGQVAETTTDEIWGDETFMSGIFEDDQLEASGVDFNNDGQLQEDEVITPDGVSAPMGIAEGDLGSDVNMDEPYVVVVHASPDAYDTYIACGTIEGAESTDNGNLVYLQGLDDTNLFGYSVLDGATMNTYIFQPNTEPLAVTPAADQVDVAGHPVGIHSGTCPDFVAEPMYDIGDFHETNVYADGQQEAGDMEGDVPSAAQDLGPVYRLAGEGTELEGDSILDAENPRVAVVHESAENYSNIVACGQILPVMDEDNLVVFLHPVAGSNQAGYLEMPEDLSTAQGFLWWVEDFSMATQPEATPIDAGTPAPISTPTATETEEATVVIEETVVVPAEEATAIVEGEQEPTEESTPMPTEAVAVEIGGDEAVDVFASPGQTLLLSNQFESERTMIVSDLGIEQTLASGEEIEATVPEDAEPGEYTYQVLQGEEVVYEGTFSVQE